MVKTQMYENKKIVQPIVIQTCNLWSKREGSTANWLVG